MLQYSDGNFQHLVLIRGESIEMGGVMSSVYTLMVTPDLMTSVGGDQVTSVSTRLASSYHCMVLISDMDANQ